MDINAIVAPTAHQPSRKALTPFTTTYYYRHTPPEQIDQVLQAHSEGTRLRGISRISGLVYNTVVSIIRASSSRALLVHNNPVEAVDTEEVSSDEMWSCVQKNSSTVCPKTSE